MDDEAEGEPRDLRLAKLNELKVLRPKDLGAESVAEWGTFKAIRIGAGAYGACAPAEVRRAFSTFDSDGILPMSKICDQRKLNQPLRMTRHLRPVANWRATASMPNVPLPGTTIAACAR